MTLCHLCMPDLYAGKETYNEMKPFYSSPVGVAEYWDKRVCVFVGLCLSACISPELYVQISCAFYLWPWLGPLLAALRHVMYFRFYGWRDICAQWTIWRHTDRYRCSGWRHCVVVRRRRCCIVLVASCPRRRRRYIVLEMPAAGGGACNAPLPCYTWFIGMMSFGRLISRFLLRNYNDKNHQDSYLVNAWMRRW